jgi:hypothetical protein
LKLTNDLIGNQSYALHAVWGGGWMGLIAWELDDMIHIGVITDKLPKSRNMKIRYSN